LDDDGPEHEIVRANMPIGAAAVEHVQCVA